MVYFIGRRNGLMDKVMIVDDDVRMRKMRLDTIGINYSARKIWVQDIMKNFLLMFKRKARRITRL